MKPYSYYNGKIVPTDKVQIPFNDIGFLRGFGIFDWLKVKNGVPILAKEHIARFLRSAKAMGLKAPMSAQQIETMIGTLLKRYKAPYAGVRLILTGGQAQGLGFKTGGETFIIVVEPLVPIAESVYKKGATLMTFEHQRLFPEVKTLNYITAVRLQKERIKKKAIEILYTYKNHILEATTSNVFFFKGNELITSNANILIGTTRNHVIELATAAGFTVVERDCMLNELLDADEVFITASNKEVLPIVAIDGKNIGNGKVGEKTQLLRERYTQSIEAYVRQYRTK